MPLHSPNFVAGGNIYPSRIVVLDNTADNDPAVGSFTVLAASTGDVTASSGNRAMVGISMPGTDYPPLNDTHVTVSGYAAVLGEGLSVYGTGDYGFLELSTAVLAGQMVTASGATSSSANAGMGVPVGAYSTAAPQAFVGIALQSGAAGEKILVRVQPGIF